MVTVTIREDSRGRLSSFFAAGHAGWADSGEDIVCAAVSTLLQAAWLGLTEVAGVAVEGSRENGRLAISWPAGDRDVAGLQAIAATVALSVERIAGQFPDHVRAIRERDDG